MDDSGWRALFRDWSWVRGEGKFPIAAYSEFMPPPRIGQKPYGSWDIQMPFAPDDPWGWRVTAAEQQRELAPGLANIARQLVDIVVALAMGQGDHRIGRRHLAGNPYWPEVLAKEAAHLAHERYLFLSPLALSRTQDDKGRVRWTLFGASQEGPAKGFWKSFFHAPSVEWPVERSRDAIRQLLHAVYDAPPEGLADLKAAGFRVLPTGPLPQLPACEDGPLPSWTDAFLLGDTVDGVRYLLTFRPFSLLPESVQHAYLSGALHLLPCPGSLVFWGSPLYRQLDTGLPLANQILLLQAVARHAGPRGVRVPQSGWLHRHGDGAHDPELGALRGTYRRTHRWQRTHRDEDSTAFAREDHLHKVLFSTHPDDVSLYNKPMARNAQIWSGDFHPILDGPGAGREALRQAMAAMANGRSFGYRFYYPPMQAGRSAVFWHRPLLACRDAANGHVKMIDSLLAGFLTAKDVAGPAIELWPRLAPHEAEAAEAVTAAPVLRAKPLTATDRAKRADTAFAEELKKPPEQAFDPRDALTFGRTASRAFEVRYWKTIAKLAEGRYLNKNSADCADDAATRARIPWPGRDLDQLGDYLLAYYRRLAAGTKTDCRVGDMPFRWQTDLDYSWMEGWRRNQEGKAHERNIVVVIPGCNRGEAVIMGDHYDTAYMEDVYGYRSGANNGARLAASGADDNHSATAALMLGAETFMALSREGRLARDIWLVHLTGEEFPSDCLGARHLAQTLVEGNCRVRISDSEILDLSAARVCGAYVLDMIAHNNDRLKDIFQIAPGADRGSLWLAFQAHAATRMWEAGTAIWNMRGARRGLGRGRRSPHGGAIPLAARHLAPHGEVRFPDDPHSTLFNTDGQIFADAGIPTVLFMENYDINREGYHDTQDTMANIDLDYGAALAAITIETVARAATEPLAE